MTLLMALAGPTLAQDTAPKASPTGDAVTEAVVVLQPTQGHRVQGTVRFRQTGKTVTVSGEISGLEPSGKHGFHVHEFGDCSAPDGASAGGHFAPQANPHGAPGPGHHAGDLGNVDADAAGRAAVSVQVADQLSVTPGPASIVGRSLVVHAKPDDLTTQPSGNSGDRVACGVIGVAKPAP